MVAESFEAFIKLICARIKTQKRSKEGDMTLIFKRHNEVVNAGFL